MAELLFIATTVFVAYVVYTAINGGKDQPEDASQPSATPESTPEPAATTPDTPPPTKPEAAKPVAAKPSGKPAETKPKAAKAATAKKTKPESIAADSVKNPKTGEIAKLPPNYSFAKRWIKEALVEEGLVDKIYKNSELNDDTNAKIQTALNALKAMKKYQ
ncbi:hypothetical protein NP590_11195 [Methylomonas sp. SURF-2]|uniref:Uncharacterized protein n=1 Tax=Methylomonas subterranea TaxID=2952225 RepID=A0ABT1THU8_9GAMM|nr:hypothetical protein [Methylomonas sp. SURF-2]MCQ8104672.1 hypothetical protein [Methylomonas sp. SURF-2]